MQLPSWLQLHPAQFILYSPERNVTVKYRNADQRLPSLPNSSCQRNTLRPHPGQPTIQQAFSLGQRKQAGRVGHVGTQADVVIWTCVDVQQALIRAICGNQLRPGHNCTQRHHLRHVPWPSARRDTVRHLTRSPVSDQVYVLVQMMSFGRNI